MRAAKLLAVLAIAALGIGSFSAVALAGKKKTTGKTTVAFCGDKKAGKARVCGSPTCGTQTCWPSLDPNPTFDKSGLVSAEGEVFSKCGHRSMRLQLLDKNGVLLTTLDTGKSDLGWSTVRPASHETASRYELCAGGGEEADRRCRELRSPKAQKSPRASGPR